MHYVYKGCSCLSNLSHHDCGCHIWMTIILTKATLYFIFTSVTLIKHVNNICTIFTPYIYIKMFFGILKAGTTWRYSLGLHLTMVFFHFGLWQHTLALDQSLTAEHPNSSEKVKIKCWVPGACKPGQLLSLRREFHVPNPPTPTRSVQTAGVFFASSVWNVSRLKHSNGVYVKAGWALHEDCKQQWRQDYKTSSQAGGCWPSEHCQAPFLWDTLWAFSPSLLLGY